MSRIGEELTNGRPYVIHTRFGSDVDPGPKRRYSLCIQRLCHVRCSSIVLPPS
jgi:hypothetical protein